MNFVGKMCCVLALGWFAAVPVQAVESWSDPALPVSQGLLVWLDASRQIAAWTRYREPPADGQDGVPQLSGGDPLDICYDASGNKRHFQQPQPAARPEFVLVDHQAVLRFDGVDDYLVHERQPGSVEEFTLFVVAAATSNTGRYRAFFAAHQMGHNDDTTGLVVDMAAPATADFRTLNVEGAGFSGAADLPECRFELGEFNSVGISGGSGDRDIVVRFDGRTTGRRPRQAAPIHLERILLGARFATGGSEPPAILGFLQGDIAEVLLFDRVLDETERQAVEVYLEKKHATLTQTIEAGRAGHVLEVLPEHEVPPVQVFVPGFSVRRLPIELTNLNNLRYRHDGKLVALAYNGNVYLLSDTDGDGLEDRAEMFWEAEGRLRGPIGMAVTPPAYEHGNGVFVSSKGKVSLIVDRDGDDRADEEKIVATGWKELPLNVDALGVTLADDGSIYFALGCADFANGHQVDGEGRAHYDVHSERGTIVRLSPDFSKRQVICTGMRFPISLAFNRHGDLFCTEQEGATWLPNGNPLDELLHIRQGRHYGFPPRHPAHLPNVIDEPSLFDYGPQHQSACGLFFNEPVLGGPTFGPARWAASAIVCGESRGKLYRTSLAKVTAGYVARNAILASLKMLTIDATGNPRGDLVVCCHSGPPDWGTGPEGTGALFQIRYEDAAAPQPLFVFPAGPRQVQIVFDRPLDPLQLKDLSHRVRIEYGPYVRAGDRFEVLEPSYAVVKRQRATPRFELPVVSSHLGQDRRTLILSTGEHPSATHYAIRMPGIGRESRNRDASELTQHDAVDLDYDLTGVAASWESADESTSTAWSGWLPSPDLDIARQFTQDSVSHEKLWQRTRQPGTLRLAGQLDVCKMLQPRVQPGAALDYVPPAEQVTVHFRSTGRMQLESSDNATEIHIAKDRKTASLTTTSLPRRLVPFVLAVVHDAADGNAIIVPCNLAVSFSTALDPRPRPLPLHRTLVPWARLLRQRAANTVVEIPQLRGGDWERGKVVYHSEQAACAKCHVLRGAGGRIGPDLSNLAHRDYESVLRDVMSPSAALNPDHITFVIATRAGQVFTGVPVAETDGAITLGTTEGKEIQIDKEDIDTMQPTSVSIMPQGLTEKFTADQLRDLMTFLLQQPTPQE